MLFWEEYVGMIIMYDFLLKMLNSISVNDSSPSQSSISFPSYFDFLHQTHEFVEFRERVDFDVDIRFESVDAGVEH